MSETGETRQPAATADEEPKSTSGQRLTLQGAVALACALLGFLLVAQVRATEQLDERLEGEREEDLTQILSDLSAESDELQAEITDLRLLLFDFESGAEREELARRSLRDRLDDLNILAGTVAAEGEGVEFRIDDPAGQVTQDLMVDAVQELRDAGAEAIAINGVRLIASSAFTTRNERLLIDDVPLESPYRMTAIGPAQTIAEALGIPGGAVDSLSSRDQVTTQIETLAHVTVPARSDAMPFVYGEPVPPEEDTG